MEIRVRIAEEKDVERVAMLYERLHDYLETHENYPRVCLKIKKCTKSGEK